MKRIVESKKTAKLQSNLHLIDFPKQNQHIFFVSDPREVKDFKRIQAEAQDEDDEVIQNEEEEVPTGKHLGEKEIYVQQLKSNLSENKSQYKRLADAIVKEEQYSKVEQALALEKQVKGKGKKRKLEDSTGRPFYKWFAERKR